MGIYRNKKPEPVAVTISVSAENMRTLRGMSHVKQKTVERLIEEILEREMAMRRIARERYGTISGGD